MCLCHTCTSAIPQLFLFFAHTFVLHCLKPQSWVCISFLGRGSYIYAVVRDDVSTFALVEVILKYVKNHFKLPAICYFHNAIKLISYFYSPSQFRIIFWMFASRFVCTSSFYIAKIAFSSYSFTIFFIYTGKPLLCSLEL